MSAYHTTDGAVRKLPAILVCIIAAIAASYCPSLALTYTNSGQTLAFTAPVGGFPADFDGDGDADFFIASTSASQIWTNNGSGIFANSGQNLGAGTRSPAIRDFDGDGDLDIAIGGSSSGIKIWKNNGSGTFTDSGQTLGSAGAVALAALDIDSDNDIDIIEGRAGSTHNIWLNDSRGNFTLSTYSFSANSFTSIKSADFNLDGFDDAAVLDGSYITIHPGTGKGYFSTNTISVANAGNSLCIDDFDADGKTDIVSISSTGANELFKTVTSPSFAIHAQSINLGNFKGSGCTTADMDNDGDADIIQTGAGAGDLLHIWLGDGAFGFTHYTQTYAFGVSAPLGAADLDNDGDVDLSVISSSNGYIYMSDRANPSGGSVANTPPSAPVLTAAGASVSSRSPALSWSAPADDHTAYTQLSYNIRIATESGKYGVYSGINGAEQGLLRKSSFKAHNLADGTYYWSAQAVDGANAKSAWAAEDSFSVSFSFIEKSCPVQLSAMAQTAKFVMADFDNDGDTDLFSASSNATYRKLYLNNGSGTLADSGQSFSATYAQGADIDNDGDIDIIADNAIYFNNGSGVFTQTSLSFSNARLCAADADNDGDTDIIAASNEKVYLNNGAGAFAPSGQTGFGSEPQVACADIDGDGDIDAITYTKSDSSMRIWKNDGTGNLGLAASQTSITNEIWENFTTADIDADGDIDILPTNGYIQINNNGTFTPGTISLSPGFPTNIAAGDLDNDGDIDAFVSSPTTVSSIFWKNNGTGNYTPVIEILMPPGYSSGVSFADIDNDTYLDIITSGGSIFINDLKDGPGGNAPANTAPSAPVLIHHADTATATVTLAWNTASDAQTPGNLLTYNVRAGTSPGASNIISSFSGKGPGRNGNAESITLRRLPNATIYWAVQTVDTAYARSAWSAEESFTVNVPVSFNDSGQILGSANTKALAAADTDNNGSPGIIESNNGASAIWTNAAGTLTQTVTLGSADSNAVSAGDIDGDADIDIVFGINGQSAIYKNNGSGAFSAASQLLDTSDTRALALFDADNDGDLDIIEGNAGASALYINDSTGSYAKSALNFGSANTNALAAADFNGDGKRDILFCNTAENPLWLNSGSGVFSNSGMTAGSGNTLSCKAADIDGDGDYDVIQGTDSGIKILLNNGNGSFTDSAQTLGSAQTRSLSIADFDHDGDLDIFAANYGAESKFWKNNGLGIFADSGAGYASGNTTSAAAADIDGDNDLDIILGVDGGSNILLLNQTADASGANNPNTPPTAPYVTPIGNPSLNTITFKWNAASDSTTPLSSLTYNLRIGKTSGGNEIFSGAIDIGPGNAGATSSYTVTNLFPGLYFWSAQAVDGDFARSAWSVEDAFNNIAPFVDSGQSLANAKTHSVTAGYFNQTAIDVVSGNDGQSTLWSNTGDGTFSDSGQQLGSDYTMSTFAADFDRNGTLDIVKAEYDGSAHIYFNSGAFTTASQTITLAGMNIFAVTGGDFDSDGDIDLAFATFNAANKIYLNDGSGGFYDSGNDIASNNSYSLYPVDIDNDGDIDLIDSTGNGVKLRLNDGGGAFTNSVSIGTGASSRAAIAFDVNGDGKQDIVRGGAKAYIFKKLPDGTFSNTPQTLDTPGTPAAFHAADVDIDGDFDLAISTNSGTTIWLNDGTGFFADSKQLLGPNDTTAIVLADFDGDSDPDLFAGNFMQPDKVWKNLRISSGSPVSPHTAPSPPAPVNIGELPPGPVKIRWNASTDGLTAAELIRYDLRVGSTPGSGNVFSGETQLGLTTAGATTSLTLSLATGTYYFAARAIDTSQLRSAWGPEMSFIVRQPDTAAPVFAGIESATDTGIGGSVDLLWSPATDDTPPISYNIYIRTATASYNFMSPSTSTAATGTRIESLDNDTQYSFTVRARDAIGHEDSNTVELSATPTAALGVRPKPPTEIAANFAAGSVSLTWAAPTQNTDNSALSDLAGYNIYRASSCDAATPSKINAATVATQTYIDSTVSAGAIYYYRVTALNSALNESDMSGCAMASSHSKGVRGRITRIDPSGGTVAETGYPYSPASGMTVKLFDAETEAGSAVSDSEGYYFIPLTGDTTGKKYAAKIMIPESTGYFATYNSFVEGVGARTIKTDITIGDSIVDLYTPKLGVGPSVADGNCDFMVNMGDFGVLKMAFNSEKGQTKYNRNADFNGDEAVNMKDFNILKENFNLVGNEVSPSPCF